MSDNAKARDFWDAAVELLTNAMASEDTADGYYLAYLAEVAVKLAQFASDNHALIAGIDENAVFPGRAPNSMGGPKVWGAPQGMSQE